MLQFKQCMCQSQRGIGEVALELVNVAATIRGIQGKQSKREIKERSETNYLQKRKNKRMRTTAHGYMHTQRGSFT